MVDSSYSGTMILEWISKSAGKRHPKLLGHLGYGLTTMILP
jgi:hypothetical protein